MSGESRERCPSGREVSGSEQQEKSEVGGKSQACISSKVMLLIGELNNLCLLIQKAGA